MELEAGPAALSTAAGVSSGNNTVGEVGCEVLKTCEAFCKLRSTPRVQGVRRSGHWPQGSSRSGRGKLGLVATLLAESLTMKPRHEALVSTATTAALPVAQHFGPNGRFLLLAHERRLLVDGQAATLGARAFDLLLAMVDEPGLLLTKNILLDRIWPGLVVQENNLAAQVSALRKVLGGELIATIPGRGYRFTGRPVAAGFALPSELTLALAESQASTPETTPADLAPVHVAPRTNLPERLTPLIGRDGDLAALGALSQAHRLITVVGAGGIGKTRLAQTFLLNQRLGWQHGVCWVELAQVNDPLALPEAIAAALGVRLGTGEPLAGLCAAVAPLRMLVALDNAEHLLSSVARVVQTLLVHAPGLHLVVTSQTPLRLAAERVFRLDALAVPSGPLVAAQALGFGAVALFTERAQAADRHFGLTDANAPTVIELCRALDGLALAIELAAARVALLGVPRLLSSMQDRFKLLTHNRDGIAPARQQTLRAAIEWSHGLLDEREQVVLRRLAVVAGSASLTFIQRLAADGDDSADHDLSPKRQSAPLDEWAVLEALSQLVERSLVSVLADDGNAEPRYRLLESTRLFALERLRAADEHEPLRRRHAQVLATQFDAQWDERHSGRVGMNAWEQQVTLDGANAGEAIAWAAQTGEPVVLLTIAATWLLAMSRSQHVERMALANVCEALSATTQPPQLRLKVALMLARTWTNHVKRRGCAAANQALTLARELAGELTSTEPDRWPLYRALAQWVESASGLSDNDPAALVAAMAELRTLEDPTWPPHRHFAGINAASLYLGRPDINAAPAEVLATARRALATAHAAGVNPLADMGNLMNAELQAGDAHAAIRTGQALLARLDGSRLEYSAAFARLNLGAALLTVNDTARAQAVLQAGWTQALVFDLKPYYADYLALLAALLDQPQQAAQLVGYADAANLAQGNCRESNETAAIERARGLACAALGPTVFSQLHALGETLQDTQIAALAFGTGAAPSISA